MRVDHSLRRSAQIMNKTLPSPAAGNDARSHQWPRARPSIRPSQDGEPAVAIPIRAIPIVFHLDVKVANGVPC